MGKTNLVVKIILILTIFCFCIPNIGCQEKIYKSGKIKKLRTVYENWLLEEKLKKAPPARKREIPKWEKEYFKARDLSEGEGNYKKAITIYQKIIKEYPEDERGEGYKDKDLYPCIASCYEGLLQFSKAYQIYSDLIKEYGTENTIYDAAKYEIDFMDKYKLVELEENRKNKKISEEKYLLKIVNAFIDERRGRQGILTLIEKAFKLNPNDPEILLRLGQVYKMEGDEILHHNDDEFALRGRVYNENALNIFKRIVREYPNSEFVDDAQYSLGEFYCDTGTVWDNDYKQAIREYEILIKKYPDSEYIPTAYLKIGDCYRWLEDYHQAIKEYERVIRYYPTTQEAISAQRYIGISYTALKDYKRAIEEYQKIVDKFPKSEDAGLSVLDIAHCYENLKDYQKAIEAYTMYIDNYAKREIDREIYKEEIDALRNKLEKK